jgi:hypothetical protein
MYAEYVYEKLSFLTGQYENTVKNKYFNDRQILLNMLKELRFMTPEEIVYSTVYQT